MGVRGGRAGRCLGGFGGLLNIMYPSLTVGSDPRQSLSLPELVSALLLALSGVELLREAIYHDDAGQWYLGSGSWFLRLPGCFSGDLPAVHLQFGRAADGPGPNNPPPPKVLILLKAADSDGSALVLPFRCTAKMGEEEKRRKEGKQRWRLTLLSWAL